MEDLEKGKLPKDESLPESPTSLVNNHEFAESDQPAIVPDSISNSTIVEWDGPLDPENPQNL